MVLGSLAADSEVVASKSEAAALEAPESEHAARWWRWVLLLCGGWYGCCYCCAEAGTVAGTAVTVAVVAEEEVEVDIETDEPEMLFRKRRTGWSSEKTLQLRLTFHRRLIGFLR